MFNLTRTTAIRRILQWSTTEQRPAKVLYPTFAQQTIAKFPNPMPVSVCQNIDHHHVIVSPRGNNTNRNLLLLGVTQWYSLMALTQPNQISSMTHRKPMKYPFIDLTKLNLLNKTECHQPKTKLKKKKAKTLHTDSKTQTATGTDSDNNFVTIKSTERFQSSLTQQSLYYINKWEVGLSMPLVNGQSFFLYR